MKKHLTLEAPPVIHPEANKTQAAVIEPVGLSVGRPEPLSHGDVARRAYEIHLERGGDGHELEDWLQAERELLEKV